MEETFIKKISINNFLNIENLEISLSETERKHLIVTGKNGSGKTTLLKEINQVLDLKEEYNLSNYFSNEAIEFNDHHVFVKKRFNGQFLLTHFEAKRTFNLSVPKGIKKVDLKNQYKPEERAGTEFIQYIVNLKAERSFARDDADEEIVAKIDQWFENFEAQLRYLFDCPDLKLEFDRKNYNFKIVNFHNGLEFGLNELSDGYSAIMTILTELILRMEAHGVKNYDMEGVVLIDEIETHLHVDLQKKVLPFLTGFFPKIQFIVTTHSPFVLSSVSNAVICDLQRKVVTEDLSAYSYEALVEGYFEADKYSQFIKERLFNYEALVEKKNLTIDEKMDLKKLACYFDQIPNFLSEELTVRIQQLKLKQLNSKGE